ncbi:hypothetical protein B0T13DRAFT_166539 [Neurospora crassa]|nr:hypothetical protein B0T13DRAFT_166539 [Neurospora crassa]
MALVSGQSTLLVANVFVFSLPNQALCCLLHPCLHSDKELSFTTPSILVISTLWTADELFRRPFSSTSSLPYSPQESALQVVCSAVDSCLQLIQYPSSTPCRRRRRLVAVCRHYSRVFLGLPGVRLRSCVTFALEIGNKHTPRLSLSRLVCTTQVSITVTSVRTTQYTTCKSGSHYVLNISTWNLPSKIAHLTPQSRQQPMGYPDKWTLSRLSHSQCHSVDMSVSLAIHVNLGRNFWLCQ